LKTTEIGYKCGYKGYNFVTGGGKMGSGYKKLQKVTEIFLVKVLCHCWLQKLQKLHRFFAKLETKFFFSDFS
jgi:hypothetical protein